MYLTKAFLFVMVALFIMVITGTSAKATVVVANDGVPQVVIATGDNATDNETWAANELKIYLQRIVAGDNFTVCRESSIPENPETGEQYKAIYVGKTQYAEGKNLCLGCHAKINFGESYTYLTIDDDGNMIIKGEKPKGTLSGVYHFLEDELGVRWYTPWVEKIPLSRSIIFTDLAVAASPRFAYRDQYTHLLDKNTWRAYGDDHLFDRVNEAADYLRRNRWNGGTTTCTDCPNPQSTVIVPKGGPHTFFDLIPPYGKDKYFLNHPEYFSTDNGVPVNLCLTNKNMRDQMIDNLELFFAKNPRATVANVSHMDAPLCDCDNCTQAVVDLGDQSGLLIWFINKIADAFPDKKILTLAYGPTAKLPINRIPPKSNVIMMVCTGLLSGQTYLPKGTESADMKILEEWVKFATNVWGYDYFFIWPPNGRWLSYFQPLYWKLDQQFKHIASMPKINGMFRENVFWGYPKTMLKEFFEMTMWVDSKLLEDPTKIMWDDNDMRVTGTDLPLINDFISGYYGKDAAPHILNYLKLQKDNIKKWPWKMVDYDYIKTAQYLFDLAEAVASGDYLTRVKEQRISLDVTTLSFRSQIVRDYLSKGNAIASYPYDVQSIHARIMNTLDTATNPYQKSTTFVPVVGYIQLRNKTKNFVKRLCNGNEYAQLPRELQWVQKEDLIEITSPVLMGEEGLTMDSEAALGLTYRKTVGDNKTNRNSCDLLDIWVDLNSDEKEDGDPVRYMVKRSMLPSSRGYKLYWGARFIPGEASWFRLKSNLDLDVDLKAIYDDADTNVEWDIYVSAKFSDAFYDIDSNSCTAGCTVNCDYSISIDRVFLVRVNPNDHDRDGKINWQTTGCSNLDGDCDYNDYTEDTEKIFIINADGSKTARTTYADLDFNAITPVFHPNGDETRNYCQNLDWQGYTGWGTLYEEEIWKLASANYPFDPDCLNYEGGCEIFTQSWRLPTDWISPPAPWDGQLELLNENLPYRYWATDNVCSSGNFPWFKVVGSIKYTYPWFENNYPDDQPMVICRKYFEETSDTDGDGIPDSMDNCPNTCNSLQLDADHDSLGDICDPTPACGASGQPECDAGCSLPEPDDSDDDNTPDWLDNCPNTANIDQLDADYDGVGDRCDNCPAACNLQQLDADSDGIGDVCDTSPGCGGCGQPACEQQCM